MPGYLVTPSAGSDISDLLEYLSERSPQAGRVFGKRLRSAMRRLGEFPQIGHVRESLAPNFLRFWPVYPYVIVYRADTSPVHIVRVLHMSRDIELILRNEI